MYSALVKAIEAYLAAYRFRQAFKSVEANLGS